MPQEPEPAPSIDLRHRNPETDKVETREETLARWEAMEPEQDRLQQERMKALGEDFMD